MRSARTALALLAAGAVAGTGTPRAGAAADSPPRAACPPVSSEGPAAAGPTPRASTTLWTHGDPTDEEQLLLELMNRARRSPRDEADRLFADYGDADVTAAVNYFQSQRPGVEWTRAENRDAFRSYAARPPLAFHAALLDAARKHTARMIAADDQSHQLPGEASLGQRILAEGYSYRRVGESVYAFAKNVLQAHAAFAIDWGQAVPQGETRPALGHRNSLMDFDGTFRYAEAGVGIAAESDPSTDVGPRVVTIDFGQPADDGTRYVTGVCYADADGDGFYDRGEGLLGVRIESPASARHTYSSSSGGYALPVPANAGSIEVVATGEEGGESAAVGLQLFRVTMAGANVKLDVTASAEPAVPEPRTYARGVAVPLADAARTEDAVLVPLFDPSSPQVGDADVRVRLTHPDASKLRLAVVAPSGAELVLWDHGPALADLSGEFDSTLAADLGGLVGEAYAGAWRLRVDDDATGGARSVDAWEVRIRPAWIRPLQAHRSLLGLKSVRVRDRDGPGADRVRISGSIDASGASLDPGAPLHVRILGLDTEHLRAGPVPPGPRVRTRFDVRGTSRATFTADLGGIDFAGVSEQVTIEVALGGAVGRESVRLRRGAWDAARSTPLPRHLSITSLESRIAASGTRATVVRGRIGLMPLGDLSSGIEVAAGDARVRIPGDAVVRTGSRIRASSASVVRRLEIDTRTGAFLVRLSGEHQPLAGGVFPLALRVGPDQYLEASVRPAGTTTLRY